MNRVEAGAFNTASEFLIDLRCRELLVEDRGFPAVLDTQIDVLDYRLKRDGWTEGWKAATTSRLPATLRSTCCPL